MKLYYVLLHIFLLAILVNAASAQTDSSGIDAHKNDSLMRHINGDSVITRISLDSLQKERDRFDSLNTAMDDSIAIANNSDANSSPSVLPVTYGIAGFLYLFNPIVLFENDKIALGVTKEISIGFGDFGQNRIAFEYSLIFRSGSSSHFRFSLKHDFLLKKDIRPSNLLQSTPVFTVGGGYFNDLSHGGIFPEISYGVSIRNNKLLLYPHIKARYTFIFGPNSEKSDIIDLSFGFMIGFANPFIDTKIRRKY